MGRKDSLQAYREAREMLHEAQEKLQGLKDLKEVVEEKADGNKAILSTYEKQVQAAEGEVNEILNALKGISKKVVPDLVRVLDGAVLIEPKALTALEEDGMTLQNVVAENLIRFDYDMENPKKGDRAADAFSAWTTELSETDPNLAKRITEALANKKISKLLE